MDNRVNYISDKLVHLRGGLKSAREATPSAPRPESVPEAAATPVAPPVPVRESVTAELPLVTPAPAPAKVHESNVPQASAQQRRLEQTEEMYRDLQQRMVRRRAQLDALSAELAEKQRRTAELSAALNRRLQALPKLRPDDSISSASALGDAYRAIDAERLDYFALDAECERALQLANGTAAGSEEEAPQLNFKMCLKEGWALALTLGAVVAGALFISALILFAAWR